MSVHVGHAEHCEETDVEDEARHDNSDDHLVCKGEAVDPHEVLTVAHLKVSHSN